MPSGKAIIEQIDQYSPTADSFAFWWLGQASVVVKIAGLTIYIDPYLSPDSSRQVPPLLKPEDITNADLVLCTHDHGDHIDPYAVAGIAQTSPQARFIVPSTATQRVIDLSIAADRVVGLNDSQAHRHDDLTVTAVKANHEFFYKTQQGEYPYLGYIVQHGDLQFYHSGDTIIYDGLLTYLQKFDFSIVFLPINGRDAARFSRGCLGNMTYQEAVDLAGQLKATLTVPIHYDMFADNAEDPQNFVDYLNVKYPGSDCWVGKPGTKVEVSRLAKNKGNS